VRHADVKSDKPKSDGAKSDGAAKTMEKSVAADKPAKPKAISKPSAKPKSTTGDARPADQKTATPRS
jgi:D-alanyl-D-alanine carboxypeptidase